MENVSTDNCWYGIFLDAYTYSTNYLLFSLTITIASVLILWIYEKPNFYKLIFKRSKHSNIILSSVPSDEAQNEDESLPNCDTTDLVKTTYTSKGVLELGKEAELFLDPIIIKTNKKS